MLVMLTALHLLVLLLVLHRWTVRPILSVLLVATAFATKAAFRVTAWGAVAMAVTAGVGMLFGARA